MQMCRGTDRLNEATNALLAILTPVEKAGLQQNYNQTAQAFIDFVVLQQDRKSKKAQKYARHFTAFLSSIQQFSAVLDTLAQAGPDLSNVIWGSVKLVIMVGLLDNE